MPVAQPKTGVIHAHGMVAAMSTNVIVQMMSKKLDFKKVRSIQFIPNGRVRVTFTSAEYCDAILTNKVFRIDDLHDLQVTESDTPVTSVYVHYLSVEAGDVGMFGFCSFWQGYQHYPSKFLWLQADNHCHSNCTYVFGTSHPVPVQHPGLPLPRFVLWSTSQVYYL